MLLGAIGFVKEYESDYVREMILTPDIVYLDCNASTPVDSRVAKAVMRFMVEEFGNAGSRTHAPGQRAKAALARAREQVAAAVGCCADEVVFTSGATESNNLALLGLERWAATNGRRHVITTAIEHHAVLEPLAQLMARGFEVTMVRPTPSGDVEVSEVVSALRPDTAIVSVMQVNNETGVIQPVDAIADALHSHDCWFHVDAAQGFGKLPPTPPRVDLVSLSGHKIFAPKGIGALVTRRRGFERPPLAPLFFGGGQERGLRPGTQPVALAVGLGVAAELARKERAARAERVQAIRSAALAALSPLEPIWVGEPHRVIASTLTVAFRGLDSEAAILALKSVAAVSNGSACTSHSYAPSHVLTAMGLPDDVVAGAVRFSWSHVTQVDWARVAAALRAVL
jgi:cysteine desulfurase